MRGAIQTLAASCLLVACGSAPPDNPDGGSNVGSDAPPGAGITVAWATPTAIPGTLDSNVSVDSVIFRVATFEVIGDAGANNPTTTQIGLEADWMTGVTPDAIEFPFAAPGVYSKLSAHLDGALVDESFEITGTAQVNGTPMQFKIHDRNDVPISLDVSGTLSAGGGLSFPIRVDFKHALDAVQFDKLDTDGGHLDLDTFDPQMGNFEHALIEAFSSPGSGDH